MDINLQSLIYFFEGVLCLFKEVDDQWFIEVFFMVVFVYFQDLGEDCIVDVVIEVWYVCEVYFVVLQFRSWVSMDCFEMWIYYGLNFCLI